MDNVAVELQVQPVDIATADAMTIVENVVLEEGFDGIDLLGGRRSHLRC